MEFFDYGFMNRALLAGMLIGLVSPVVGVFLVLRRLSLMGDTLAHISLAGVAAGILAGIYPMAAALVFSVGAALSIERLRRVYSAYAELAIAIMLSAGIALAVILLSIGKSFNADLMGYLFGSIIAVTKQDLWLIAGVGALILTAVILFYKELFAITFDEEGARVMGLPVSWINLLFAVLTALTIALAMRVVGILLVSSLMTLPVAASLQLARSFKGAMVWSVVFGQVAVVGGLLAAYYGNLAPGGSIVLLAVCLLLVVLAWKRWGGLQGSASQ